MYHVHRPITSCTTHITKFMAWLFIPVSHFQFKFHRSGHDIFIRIIISLFLCLCHILTSYGEPFRSSTKLLFWNNLVGVYAFSILCKQGCPPDLLEASWYSRFFWLWFNLSPFFSFYFQMLIWHMWSLIQLRQYRTLLSICIENFASSRIMQALSYGVLSQFITMGVLFSNGKSHISQ